MNAMSRKSERLLEKKMSEYEENKAARSNSTESLQSHSEGETTITEQTTTTAELKEEILQLKNSLKVILEKCQNSNIITQVQQSNEPYVLPSTTATLPAVANCPNNTPAALPAVADCQTGTPPTLPASIPPMQQFNSSEYKMPFTYYLPDFTAQQRAQTTVSMPFLPHPTQIFANTAPRVSSSVSCSYMSPHLQNIATPASAPQAVDRHAYRELRKLHDLPEFSGQPEHWPMFNVAYNETTRVYNYSNLENLMRLQKALKGEAKTKVETFLIHPNSVSQVMTTLEFYYGRPQVLIRSQIAKVRAFPQISGRKMYELVNLSTMVSNLTAFLENAGATPHLSNPTLIDELVNKLPPSKKEEWMRYSVINLGQYPSVRQFSTWLQEVASYVALAAETGTPNVYCVIKIISCTSVINLKNYQQPTNGNL